MISDFIKQIGLSAALILGACILGIFNLGIFGYKFTSITLFIFIGVVYMMFHVPTLWDKIWGFLKPIGLKILSYIKAIFKKTA